MTGRGKIVIAAGLALMLALAACGKKGDPYRPAPEDQPAKQTETNGTAG